MNKWLFLLLSTLLFACKEEAKRPIEDIVADSKIYLKVNKLDSALQLVEQALQLDKNNLSALETKVRLIAKTKPTEVQKFLDELPQNFPLSNKQLLSASNNYKNGKLAEAKLQAQQAFNTFQKLVDNETDLRVKKTYETNAAFAQTIIDSNKGKAYFNALIKKYGADEILNKFSKLNPQQLANTIIIGE